MSWQGTKKHVSRRQIKAPEDGLQPGPGPRGWLGRRLQASLQALQKSHGPHLARGRTLAKAGRVRGYWISPGMVGAEVWDEEVIDVRLRFRTWDEDIWSRITDLLSRDLRLLATLLEGRLPERLVDALDRVDLRMIPSWSGRWMDDTGIERGDVEGDCSCGEDWHQPCAHMVAVHHVLASSLDTDPFQVLALRGRDRSWIIGSLQARWGDASAPAATPPPEPDLDDWYGDRTARPSLSLTPTRPSRIGVGLAALGPPPGDDDPHHALDPLYAAAAERAQDWLFSELELELGRPSDERWSEPEAEAVTTPEEASTAAADAPSEPEIVDQIIDLLAEEDGLTTAAVSRGAHAPPDQVKRALQQLEEAGLVVRTGRTRGTRWHLG